MATTVEDVKLRITVEGEGKIKAVSAAMGDLKKDVDAFGQVGGPLGNTINGIVGRLGGLATAGLGAAVVFAGLAMKAIQMADALQDISDATGISAGSLNNFKNSLIDAGGKADDFIGFATKLTKNLGEAALGNEAAQKSFEKLGVFVRDSNGNIRDGGTVLQEVIGKLAAIPDPATRSAMAIQLLGKEAAKIDFTKVNAINDPFKDAQIAQLAKYQGAIDSLISRINDGLITAFGTLALKMSEAEKKADEIAKKAMAREEELNKQGKTSRLPGREAPFPLPGQPSVTDMPPRPDFERNIQDYEKPAFELQKKITEAYKDQQRELKRLQSIGQQGTGDFGATPEATLKAIAESEKRIAQSRIESNKLIALQGANDIVAVEVNARAELLKAISEINSKEKISQEQKDLEIAAKTKEINLKSVNDISKLRLQQNAKIYSELEAQRQKSNDELAAEDKRINDIIESSRQLNVEQNNQIDSQKRKNKFLSDNLTATDRERANAQALFDLEEQRINLLKQVANIKDLPYAERLQKESEINQQIDSRIGLTQQQQELDIRGQENFSIGWSKAYNQYLENTRNAANTAASLFQTLTTGFEDAWVKFVKTGKLSFKDLVNSMIADLARAQARNLFASLFGPVGSNNNLSGPASAALLGLPGYAAGGMIPANQLSVVGEKGPELFIPKTSGTIIPNNMLSAGSPAGLGNTSVTYNINAVDALSFKSMIARDPSFIHAVAMQGAKGTPGRY
jgi:lambda family phage tail tape measure protein